MRQSFRLWWNRDQSQCWCTFWHEACTVSFALFCRFFFRVSRVHNPFNQIPKSDFFCCYMCACMLSTCYRNLFFLHSLYSIFFPLARIDTQTHIHIRSLLLIAFEWFLPFFSVDFVPTEGKAKRARIQILAVHFASKTRNSKLPWYTTSNLINQAILSIYHIHLILSSFPSMQFYHTSTHVILLNATTRAYISICRRTASIFDKIFYSWSRTKLAFVSERMA